MRAREFIQIGRDANLIVSWDKESLQKLGLTADKLDLVLDGLAMFLQEAVVTIRDFPENIQPLLSDLYEEKLVNLAEVHRLLLADPDNMKRCELMGRKVSESHVQRLSEEGLRAIQAKRFLMSLQELQNKATSAAVALPRNVPFVKMAHDQFVKLRKIYERTFLLPHSPCEPSSSGLTFLATRTAMTFALISAAGLSQEEADEVRQHVMFFAGMVAVLQEDLAGRLRNLLTDLVLDMLDLFQSEGCPAEDVSKSLEDRSRDAYNHAWISLDRKTLSQLNAQELDSLADAYANLGGYFIGQARMFTPPMMRVFAKAALNQVDAEDKDARTRN
jgi:hypothetical protein